MEALRASEALEFEMVYHVASRTFEKVLILKKVLGQMNTTGSDQFTSQQSKGDTQEHRLL